MLVKFSTLLIFLPVVAGETGCAAGASAISPSLTQLVAGDGDTGRKAGAC